MASEFDLAAFDIPGVYVVGIGIAGQPLALGIGNQNGTPSFVSVVTNSGNPTPWQLEIVSSNGSGIYKCQISDLDGRYFWVTPGDALPNCVGLVLGGNVGATMILNADAGTLEAAFGPGGYMAPTGGPNGFYFALNNNASAQLTFFAQQ